MKRNWIAAAALLLASACDQPQDAGEAEPTVAERSADDAEPSGDASQRERHLEHLAKAGAGAAPKAVLRTAPGAKAAFTELEQLIRDKYVDGPLSEDALYTAALEGVLDRLIQLPEHRINALLSPEELAELEIGTKGKLLGIGVMIERVADVVVVRDVIAGGPAEAGGLQAGDRILGIDGERLKDLTLPDIVSRIRGAEGSKVELFVQRDIEEWNETLTRGQISVASVNGEMLDEDTGYLNIHSFSEETAAQLDATLAKLTEAGMKSLVLDLRTCPGGLFQSSLEAGSRLLPAGARIVTVKDAEGEETHHVSEGEFAAQKIPVVVLIGKYTASGAEILAAAIRENDRGVLVGEQTMGKGTVESIHELDNGWAVKLSIMRFFSPQGESPQSVGVAPDIRVPAGDKAKRHEAGLDPAVDPQLGAALEVLSASAGG